MAHVNEPIVSFRLASDQWLDRLDRMASEQERSRAVILRRAIQVAIEEHEAAQKKGSKK